MKLGMEINDENIQRAVEALGVASQYGGEMEEREPAAFGGIMDSNSGRRAYGLGSVFKSITKPFKKAAKAVKKIAKSDLGKAAILYLATAGASNYFAGAGQAGAGGTNWGNMFGNAQSKGWLNPAMVGSNVKESFGKLPFVGEKESVEKVVPKMDAFTEKAWNKVGELSAAEKHAIATWKKTLQPAAKATPWYKSPWFTIPAASIGAGAYTKANPGETDLSALDAARDTEVDEFDQWLAAIRANPTQYTFGENVTYPYPNYPELSAEGGRIGRQEGGIMNLGGGEKDYRNTGGFVDIGAKEKADDVPARLSVNEFVMTADAVRGAGDGDVDEGAERLQRTMKQLEQKGKRHKAAQGMFATSQRLGEVI